MAGNAQNIRLGPCRVIWGVEDLGFTKGGVEVTFTSTQVNITSDQFGDTPMDKYLTSRTVTAKVPLIETIPGKLDLIVNGGDGTAELADVQTVAGLSMRNASQSLVLHPLSKADDDYSEDFVVIRAGVVPNIEPTYDTDNERVWSVTFVSFPYYGEFGDIMGANESGVAVYGGRSAVVANGGLYRKSNRTTMGAYFDKTGAMQIAPDGVTRPNFVYQNGVWKQEGWLLEAQATNIVQSFNYKSTSHLYGVVTADQDSALSFNMLNNPWPASALYCMSVFVNRKISTATYLDYWLSGGSGNGNVFSITDNKYENNGPFANAQMETYGDWTRLWMYYECVDTTDPNGVPLWIPRNGSAVFCCPQSEVVPDVNTPPSSYIPVPLNETSAVTRSAD